MKYRQGFVSNSSSSSFVIEKKHLTDIQLKMILEHRSISTTLGLMTEPEWDVPWTVRDLEETVEGSTSMDNFDMHHYLHEVVGIRPAHIVWGEF